MHARGSPGPEKDRSNMVMEIRSSVTLKRHRGALQRAIDDFREGKKIDHLSQKEVAQMISAMEQRLTKVEERLRKIER